MFRRLKQIVLFVLLGALFLRGNASGLHHHVEFCQKFAQELCCDHGHNHDETPPLPSEGHCHHECHQDVLETAGLAGALGEVLSKPILRPIGLVMMTRLSFFCIKDFRFYKNKGHRTSPTGPSGS